MTEADQVSCAGTKRITAHLTRYRPLSYLLDGALPHRKMKWCAATFDQQKQLMRQLALPCRGRRDVSCLRKRQVLYADKPTSAFDVWVSCTNWIV